MKNGKGSEIELSITLFFPDFEDCWSAKDLFFEFKEVGEIDEIVIPTKKDWRGRNMDSSGMLT